MTSSRLFDVARQVIESQDLHVRLDARVPKPALVMLIENSECSWLTAGFVDDERHCISFRSYLPPIPESIRPQISEFADRVNSAMPVDGMQIELNDGMITVAISNTLEESTPVDTAIMTIRWLLLTNLAMTRQVLPAYLMMLLRHATPAEALARCQAVLQPGRELHQAFHTGVHRQSA